jgi:hypothetical protein
MHQDGKNFTVKIWGRIYHPSSGRSVTSFGACSSDEPGKGYLPTIHNVTAVAHTRMKNRGISDILGSGEVSSEEFIAEAEERQPTPEEVAAREKAKNMGKAVCPDCSARFETFEQMTDHRREHLK